jgi:hypothetical protein
LRGKKKESKMFEVEMDNGEVILMEEWEYREMVREEECDRRRDEF